MDRFACYKTAVQIIEKNYRLLMKGTRQMYKVQRWRGNDRKNSL